TLVLPVTFPSVLMPVSVSLIVAAAHMDPLTEPSALSINLFTLKRADRIFDRSKETFDGQTLPNTYGVVFRNTTFRPVPATEHSSSGLSNGTTVGSHVFPREKHWHVRVSKEPAERRSTVEGRKRVFRLSKTTIGNRPAGSASSNQDRGAKESRTGGSC